MEPFLTDTVIAQYFKCFVYGHQARVCKNKAVCGACGGQHERRACSILEQLLKPKCCNCQGSHPAWASICPKCQEAAKKAREAWISRLGKYEIPSSTLSTPAPQLPSTSFSLSHPLPGGKRCKTAEPTRSSDRIREFPEVQILSTDQSLQERSFQTSPSRSPMLRCLHEELKAFPPPVQCAEKSVSSRSTTDNSSPSRSGHDCTPEALEESPPGNQHFNCFLFFYSFVFLRIGQNSFPYQQEAQTFLPSSHFLE